MSSPEYEDGPWVGGLLRLAWERVRARIDTAVRAAGYDDLNQAHLALFRYDGPGGQRPSRIADQMRITKQSLNDLLRHLEHTGYVELVPDPADSRARLVRLTPRGRQLNSVIRIHARNVDQQLRDTIGRRLFEQFRQTLLAINDESLLQPIDPDRTGVVSSRGGGLRRKSRRVSRGSPARG